MQNEPIYKNIESSRVTLSVLMQPSHSNFGGKIHGGYILSLMDQIAFASASKYSGHYCVTASVDTVDFLNPIEIGELVTMKAQVNYVGKSSMVIGIRVESENIQNGFVKHCNSSFFTMVAKNTDGSKAEVPALILKDQHDVRRFVKCIKRKEMKLARSKEFHDTDFVTEKYVNLLKDYRVRVAANIW